MCYIPGVMMLRLPKGLHGVDPAGMEDQRLVVIPRMVDGDGPVVVSVASRG